MTEYKDCLTKSAADYRMKNKTLTMMTARAAMTLLALFCILGGANAQKTLPYEYGFENMHVDDEGWSRVDNHKLTDTALGSMIEGKFLFLFYENHNNDQYLISPELESGSAISVLFWYMMTVSDKHATFEVGYSTTTKDISAFTWDKPRTHTGLGKHPYSNTYPAGTKYIAIRYYSSSNWDLLLDAFKFTKSAPVSLPYEFSVENYPEEEGWSRVDCPNSTDQWYHSPDARTGQCSFRFSLSEDNEPQYLISPEFSSSSNILLSFWYKGGSSFQVGYSTTTKDVSAFTWGEKVPCIWGCEQYENDFPAGTKYVAIKYESANTDNQLSLDDFSFTKVSHYGTWLASCGNDKLAIIQTLRDQLGIELTAAKALAGSAPCYVLTNVSEEEAEALARALNIRGATAYAKDMKNSSGTWQPDSGEGYVTCLLDCGDDKMAIIKTLKEMLGLDLKVAKDLADAAPCVVLET